MLGWKREQESLGGFVRGMAGGRRNGGTHLLLLFLFALCHEYEEKVSTLKKMKRGAGKMMNPGRVKHYDWQSFAINQPPDCLDEEGALSYRTIKNSL